MDGAHMKPRSVRIAPPIPTAATRSLEISITRLTRRRPDVRATIDAIRAGDNEVLLRLVHEARAGDSDAASIAIWSLLPRLCAVIRSRMAPPDWRDATDEYLGLAYLTIREVNGGETAAFLADKLIARVRRRHERLVAANRRFTGHLTRAPHGELVDPYRGDPPVDEHALVRVRLRALRDAAHADPEVRADLALVVAAIQQSAPKPGPRRMAVLRSRRRLLVRLDEAA